MSLDPFSDALNNIKNSDFVAKKECAISPATNMLGKVLTILKNENYIDDFSKKRDGNKDVFVIKLNGNITNCKAIKPRYAVKNLSFEKFEKRYLPAKGLGILVVSSPKGIISHVDAKKNNIGGRLLAFVY